MQWVVEFHPDFANELFELSQSVQNELFKRVGLLKNAGPRLDRPHAGTLKNPKHPNMKELRFNAEGGVWRVCYAFDPNQSGILLVAGDKSGGSESLFYKKLLKKANQRYDDHLSNTEPKQ
jgi:hypothetical protein